MATPQVPQRPARFQQNLPAAGNIDIPQVPPRPKRNLDRSVSPNRDSYARSPLNDPSFHKNGKLHGLSQLSKSISREVPPRPPSVDNFPTIGHEGNEYEAIHAHLDTPDVAIPKSQTTNAAGDLPLHAPKASLPASTAKSRIQAVTRTDSSQAAAAGIGKANSEDHFGASLTRSNSSQPSRPTSLYSKDTEHDNFEQGIPEIGLQIPLYPNAGDVQAPTPSPSVHGMPGVQLTASAPTGRHHSRTKSGREIFHGPPGSYGLHGHGVVPKDPLEKAWYQRHPDELAREVQGEYGPAIREDRKEWALSSEELNKLVHESHLPGIATSDDVVGTPDEQIGYIASEEFASRMASPRPSSATPGHARRSSSQVLAESPLRKMSFPVNEAHEAIKAAAGGATAVESEAEHEDGEVIHIDPPSRSHSKVTGGGYESPTEDPNPHGGSAEGGYFVEEGNGVPILAPDEVSRHPEVRYMQPVIEPKMEERADGYFAGVESEGPLSSQSGRRSNNHSRSNSLGAPTINLQRFTSNDERPETGTPLEDVKEYEPLFPEDEEKKPNLAQKLKRPDLARHHFPSSDIWEDTPESLMYETTVKTPQLPDKSLRAAEHEPAEIFETPEAEEARKKNITEKESTNFIPHATRKMAKTGLNADVHAEMLGRAGVGSSLQRFPSRDIWEDTPDHHMHTTIITPEPQKDETTPVERKPPVQHPQVPARPTKSKAGQVLPPALDGADTPPIEKRAPIAPERPKPQVPARPSKPLSRSSDEQVPLTKTPSLEKEAPPVKAKPAIPARPVGSKIAALQAGFMKDLNQRLQLGPQAPKKEEPKPAEEEQPEEKAPLADARKGRARGPSRRKPGVSPTPAAAVEEKPAQKAVTFSFSAISTVWEADREELLVGDNFVPSKPTEPVKPARPAAPSESITPEPVSPPDAATKEDTSADMELMVAEDKPAENVSGDEVVTSTAAPVNKTTSKDSTETAIQTGQKDITLDSGTVDAEGKEHVGEGDALGTVEKTIDEVQV